MTIAGQQKQQKEMMSQFRVCYIPGGMSLEHSAWWLCETMVFADGTVINYKLRFIKRADYK
jgi:hypothetical protein